MDEITALAKKHNLKVIEDGAQAIGVQYKDGRKVGNHGDIGCFSFFPSKNLGCFGDGGLVITNNDELGAKLRIMRVHGGKPKYYHKIIGGNFRLDAIQAAVLNVKLPHLDSWSEKRRKNAGLYTKLFMESGVAGKEGITEFSSKEKVLLPGAIYKDSGFKNYHIYNQYVIRVQNRDDVRKHLTEKEVSTEIYYPVPFHKQECFASLKSRFENTSFVNSERASNETIALPIYPELRDEQIEFVVETIIQFISFIK
jgi:dTDP-4-amino-4,6-dideoxygalactose transaminase